MFLKNYSQVLQSELEKVRTRAARFSSFCNFEDKFLEEFPHTTLQ